jgi:hypothetical protein
MLGSGIAGDHPDGRPLYAAIDGLHGEDGPESPERVVVIDTATKLRA